MGRLDVIIVFWLLATAQYASAQVSPSQHKEAPTSSQAHEVAVREVQALLDSSITYKDADLLKALRFSLQAVNKATSIEEPVWIRGSLLNTGTIFFYSGLYDKAIEYYTRYYNLVVESGDVKEQLTIRTNIQAVKLAGTTAYDSSLFHEMEEDLQQYLVLWEETRDTALMKINIPNLLNNLALLAQYNDTMLHLAEGYLRQSLDIVRDYSVPLIQEFRIRIVYAQVLQKMGRLEEAYDICKNVAVESERNRFVMMEALAKHTEGALLEEIGKIKPAIEAYLKAIELAGEKNYSQIKESAEALARLYEMEDESDKALEYIRLSQTAVERINKDKAKAEMARLELKRELNLLETSLKKKNRSNVVRLLSLSGGVLLLALVIFALFLSARRKQKVEKLEKIKATLDSQKFQLENQLLAARLDEKDKKLTSELVYKLSRNQMVDAAVRKLLEHNRNARYRAKLIEDVVAELRESKGQQDAWQEFDILFQETHKSFYKNLNETCPKLTNNERRLAAMLRMNMNNREISALTGQSTRAIEMARIRLRKKLELTNTDVRLIEFLTSL